MSRFTVHTLASAPEQSRPALESLAAQIGMIPNLAASMAESPELLNGFLAVRQLIDGGTFSQAQVQVLALANAFENGCTYCIALHSTLALNAGVSPGAVAALRAGREPEEPQLAALSRFTRCLVQQRGHIERHHVDAFLAAGFTTRQALEVVLQVAASIMPNFAHHLTGCPLDAAFEAQRWEPADAERQTTPLST